MGQSSTSRGSSSSGGGVRSSAEASTQTGGSSTGEQPQSVRSARGGEQAQGLLAACGDPSCANSKLDLDHSASEAPGTEQVLLAELLAPSALAAAPRGGGPAEERQLAATEPLAATVPLPDVLPVLAVDAAQPSKGSSKARVHEVHPFVGMSLPSPLFPDIESELRELNVAAERPTPVELTTPAILAGELLPTGRQFDFRAGADDTQLAHCPRLPAVSEQEAGAACQIQAAVRGWRGRRTALRGALDEAQALRALVASYERNVLSPMVVAHASRCAMLRCELAETRSRAPSAVEPKANLGVSALNNLHGLALRSSSKGGT